MEPSTTPTLTDLLAAAAGRLAAALDGYENGDEVKSLATAYGILRDKERLAAGPERQATPQRRAYVQRKTESVDCSGCEWTSRGVGSDDAAKVHVRSTAHELTVHTTYRYVEELTWRRPGLDLP